MSKLVEWWQNLPPRVKVNQALGLLWMPFWFFAPLPSYLIIPAFFGVAMIDTIAAYLICEYLGWYE